MNNAVIGLGQVGAAVLTHFHETFTKRLGGNSLPADLFYVQSHDNAPASLPFVARSFPLLRQSIAAADQEMASIIKSYGQPEKAFLNGLRRIHALQFRQESQIFEQSVQSFFETARNPSIYIIAQADNAATSAVLTEILYYLNNFTNTRIYVQLFYLEQLDQTHAAMLYALLCELDRLNHITLQHFSHQDKTSFNTAIQESSLQILQAITTIPLTFGVAKTGEKYPQPHHFLHCRELSFVVDRPKIREDLIRFLSARLMIQSLNTQQKDEQQEMPSWVYDLFEDKRWLMHPDFICRDQDMDGEQKMYGLISAEWDSRIRFFTSQIKKDSTWQEQVQHIVSSLSNVHHRLFRGSGVDVFFAINENAMTHTAERIVRQIEVALVDLWVKERVSWHRLSTIINTIVQDVEVRLNSSYQINYSKRQYNADTCKADFDSFIYQFENASSRQLKQMQKEYPIEKVADILRQYYLADSYAKSLAYACSLLSHIVYALNKLKERVENMFQTIEKQANKWVKFDEKMTMRLLSPSTLGNQHVYAIAGHDKSTLEAMLPKKITLPLSEEIWEICVFDAGKNSSFNDLRRLWAEEITLRKIMKKVSEKCPPMNPEQEQRVLWHLMERVLKEHTKALGQAIGSSIHDNSDARGAWLFPIVPKNTDIRNFVDILSSILPGRPALINIDMDIPMILYRDLVSVPTSQLRHFTQWKEAYTQLVTQHASGAIHSMLLFTQNQLPFPEDPFGEEIELPKPDKMRDYLLRGELLGVLLEMTVPNRGEAVVLRIGEKGIVIAENFQVALTSIQTRHFNLLRHEVDKQTISKPLAEIRQILDLRLENIKAICLNGKTDLKKATWEEAGRYMPWARVADKIVSKIKKEEKKAA